MGSPGGGLGQAQGLAKDGSVTDQIGEGVA